MKVTLLDPPHAARSLDSADGGPRGRRRLGGSEAKQTALALASHVPSPDPRLGRERAVAAGRSSSYLEFDGGEHTVACGDTAPLLRRPPSPCSVASPAPHSEAPLPLRPLDLASGGGGVAGEVE
jgi:hypothetical protein